MRKNTIRLMVLGMLIVLCIGQTAMLWLGDMSGHHFFSENVVSNELTYVHPKQIWININGNISNGGIYRLENSVEKEKILSEIVIALRQDNLSLDLSPKEDYMQLLYETQGISYEFGTNLTIDEIIGQDLCVRTKKYSPIKIKEIYVDLSTADTNKVYIYLIDEEAKVRQKITLDSKLTYQAELIGLYKEKENVQEHQIYQSSLTSGDEALFTGNVFYPQIDREHPVTGSALYFEPIIQELEGKELENYVNSLFKNPSYKIKNVIQDGITFTDNLNISVKYNRIGTLEFRKTLLNNYEKLNPIERMNKINTFVNTSEAIPNQLKKGLYLEEIETDEVKRTTYYKFGYRYEDGEIVVLSEAAKRQLGIQSFLELGLKNNEIISGKWVMLKPNILNGKIVISTAGSQAFDEIYTNSNIPQDEEFILKDLECGYIMNESWKRADFKWIGKYNKQYIWH